MIKDITTRRRCRKCCYEKFMFYAIVHINILRKYMYGSGNIRNTHVPLGNLRNSRIRFAFFHVFVVVFVWKHDKMFLWQITITDCLDNNNSSNSHFLGRS